jgi:gluconokinase
MGVSGVGKSTVGRALHRRLGWVYAEGDDFHSPANVAKMSSGVPLTDDDRWPWLASIATWIGQQESLGRNCIVTCSALRQSYRDVLRSGHPSTWFLHLVAPRSRIAERLARRKGHFMPASLLDSQLDQLDGLSPTEPGATIENSGLTAQTVAEICALLAEDGRLS